MLKQLKRQYHNVFKIKAVSPLQFFINAVLFPIRHKFNLNSKPINIVWDITYRCNLNCRYCLFAKNKLHTFQNELPTDKILEFAEKASKYKPSFYFTGGEPLLRNDLETIVGKIHSLKMRVGLNTNTTLAAEKRLLSLDEAGLDYIIISLDMNEIATDSVRGSGVYDKAVGTIKMIKDLKLKMKVIVNCVLSETNYHHLDAFLDFIDLLDIDALKISYIYFNTKEEAQKHYKECASRLEEKIIPDCFEKELPGCGVDISEKVESVMPKIKKMKIPVSFNPNLSKSEIINWFDNSKKLKRKCLYTFNVVRISPNGDIYPCHFINKPVGNISSDDLLSVYNNKFYKKLRGELKKSLLPGCVRCNKL